MSSQNGKKVLVYNLKGGVGKTDIAINLALKMDVNFITNEPSSPIELVLEEGSFLKLQPEDECPVLPSEYSAVFDFGGYLDKRAITALKQVDVVIVPVVNEFKDVYTTIQFIQEIEEYNKNIIVVANKTEKNDYEEIKQAILPHYLDYPIFNIKYSRGLPNLMKYKMGIQQMIDEFPQHRRFFKVINKQFDEIIEAINND